MIDFKDLSDDFYVNVNLNTEMDILSTRDSVMHYFEQVQKQYPSMKNFYARARGEFVLEEEKEPGYYRWTSVEKRRVCSGYVNPPNYEDAIKQHISVLELLPYTLSISGLDCESLNFMYGFDFTYRGNHADLIAEALGVSPAFEPLIRGPATKLIGVDPSVQFALDSECRVQCRISAESRSSTLAIRTGEFPEEQLSVYLTIRRYGSLPVGTTYATAIKPLQEHAETITREYLAENVLIPLQRAIAIR